MNAPNAPAELKIDAIDSSPQSAGADRLVWPLLALALPVLGENILHMLVGLNDTYLANHLPYDAADAGAAVGTITYFLWFFGLLVSSIGVGSTAIIARARGSRHKSLANAVTGQSVAAAAILGLFVGIVLFWQAPAIVTATQLHGKASAFALSYLRMLSVTLPFTMVMFIANSCLRGGGDTIRPAVVMIAVDIINMLFSFALTRGWWGLHARGYNGIAEGTIIAYVCGGLIQLSVLLIGTRAATLYLHRLRPHWITIKRLMRVGAPAGVQSGLSWLANFGVIAIINHMDSSNISSAAHINTVRIESISFMPGLAFGTAAATLVGMSLGMNNPRRAARATYLAFAMGGGVMTLLGLAMIFLGHYPAVWLAGNEPHVIELTTRCLRITGFIQIGFAANLIFGGALSGAGDTLVVMYLGLATVLGIRFVGVVIVGLYLKMGLAAVWVMLACELFLRGLLTYLRFVQGSWKKISV